MWPVGDDALRGPEVIRGLERRDRWRFALFCRGDAQVGQYSPNHVVRCLALLSMVFVGVGCGGQRTAEESALAGKPSAAPSVATSQAPVNAGPQGGKRTITFNGAALSERGWRVLEQLEAYSRVILPDGAYWYDAESGAAGQWGGPAAVLLLPGLPLGGALPADASGGGSGRLSGVFVNGRELHPNDVSALTALLGQVWPGRWWVNARGDFGPEGGAMMGNLRQAAAARGGSAWSHGSSGPNGFWAGGDGNGYVWAMDNYSGCSFASDGGGVIC